MKRIVRTFAVIAFCFTVASSFALLSACKCRHEWSSWTVSKQAACETEGEKTRSCYKCGEGEKEVLPALGHEEIIDEEVEPTCTEEGKTEGKHCARCGKAMVEQNCVPALGHEEVIDAEAVEATCLTAGKTAKKHCSRCGEILSKQEVLPALGHKNKNGICLNCKQDISTKGLKYEDGEKENTLIVAGIGTATDKNIIIPAVYEGKKVVAIKQRCFIWKNIVDVEIPDSVTSIGSQAFQNCGNLKSIVIPDSVTDLGYGAFHSCGKLESVTIRGRVDIIDDRTFESCISLKSIIIPDGVTRIGAWAFYYCESLVSVTIPNSVTKIGVEAFNHCSGIKEVNFKGTKTQWAKISDNGLNSCLMKAKINYIS